MLQLLWCAKCETTVGRVDILEDGILLAVKTMCKSCLTTTTFKTENANVEELKAEPGVLARARK